jgi:hypothetical protein
MVNEDQHHSENYSVGYSHIVFSYPDTDDEGKLLALVHPKLLKNINFSET